jgi:hypothetical protein
LFLSYLRLGIKNVFGSGAIDVDMLTRTGFNLTDSTVNSLLVIAEPFVTVNKDSCTDAVGIKTFGQASSFSLEQNFPNPFNPSTVIGYKLSVTSSVILSVYNILGEKVATLVNETKPPGEYASTWNGRNDSGLPMGGGVYFVTLSGESANKPFVEMRKIVLMR